MTNIEGDETLEIGTLKKDNSNQEIQIRLEGGIDIKWLAHLLLRRITTLRLW